MTDASAQDLPTIPYTLDDEMLQRTREDGQPRVRVYRFDHVAVVIGRGGKQNLELFPAAIAADGIPLYKRPGGGCSVVLDPGNAIVSLALPLPGIGHIKSSFAAISAWMIAALDAAGIPDVEQHGVSDLVLNGRKIGGSCVYRTRGLLYYSTTLLCAQNMPLVGKYLRHPPREPEYRQGRPHEAFMGSLAQIYGVNLDETFLRNLKSRLDCGLTELVRICEKSC